MKAEYRATEKQKRAEEYARIREQRKITVLHIIKCLEDAGVDCTRVRNGTIGDHSNVTTLRHLVWKATLNGVSIAGLNGHAQSLLSGVCVTSEVKTAKPSRHVPGSREKIEDLARRVRDGQDLWHPEDVTTYCYC